MELNKYQSEALTTAIYPKAWAILYPALGLAGEAGEVCDKIKKIIRDGGYENIDQFDGLWVTGEQGKEIAKEIGDVFWYLSVLAYELGYSLEDIARINIDKLRDRQKRGVLCGSGDNR